MRNIRIRTHIQDQIERAELHSFPFPHLIIENFFPDDVYADILRFNLFRNNEGEQWHTEEASAAKRTETPYWMRNQINFHKAVSVLTESSQEGDFWNDLNDLFLRDDWFVRQVMRKFPDYFIIRFGLAMMDPAFPSMLRKELFLQQHKSGYQIGPHTDVPERIFTCIFSFADTHGFEEYGTRLCVPTDPLVRCWGNGHHEDKSFLVDKVAPYKPNNFLLFFKTRQSFHSVRRIDAEVPNHRYGMQFQLIEPSGGLFKDLSEPNLMRAKI